MNLYPGATGVRTPARLSLEFASQNIVKPVAVKGTGPHAYALLGGPKTARSSQRAIADIAKVGYIETHESGVSTKTAERGDAVAWQPSYDRTCQALKNQELKQDRYLTKVMDLDHRGLSRIEMSGHREFDREACRV